MGEDFHREKEKLGIKINKLASKLSISRNYLYKKINGESKFTKNEVEFLVNLGFNKDIFKESSIKEDQKSKKANLLLLQEEAIEIKNFVRTILENMGLDGNTVKK